MIKTFAIILFFFGFFLNPLMAQTPLNKEEVKQKVAAVQKKEMSEVKRALLYSIVPGGGQIYNKKYWKVPIIYGGFAALIYSFSFYNTEYNRVRQAYKESINGQPISDPTLVNVPQDMLYNVRESYRKSRDLSVIGFAGLYLLNFVDAAVDANFRSFDVNENLSLKVRPTYQYAVGSPYMGLSLKLDIH